MTRRLSRALPGTGDMTDAQVFLVVPGEGQVEERRVE